MMETYNVLRMTVMSKQNIDDYVIMKFSKSTFIGCKITF